MASMLVRCISSCFYLGGDVGGAAAAVAAAGGGGAQKGGETEKVLPDVTLDTSNMGQ